jgi:hypothetical protein
MIYPASVIDQDVSTVGHGDIILATTEHGFASGVNGAVTGSARGTVVAGTGVGAARGGLSEEEPFWWLINAAHSRPAIKRSTE